MPEMILRAFRSLGAVIAGYAVIVIGTTLTLTVVLENQTYAQLSLGEHAVGAMGTVLSGLLGGYVAAWAAGRAELWHALGLVAILAAEITWIITSDIGSNPTWFDLAGGLTLMLTALAGAWVRVTLAGPGEQTAPAG